MLVFVEISPNQDIHLDTIITFSLYPGRRNLAYENYKLLMLPVAMQSSDMVLISTYQLENSRHKALA